MPVRPMTLAAITCFSLASAEVSPGQAISHIEPPGVSAGTSVELRVCGQRLERVTGVLVGAEPAEPLAWEPDGSCLRVRFSVSSAELPRLVPLRVATRSGISNMKPLMMDDLPMIEEQEPNNSPRTAQPIPLNVAIAGKADRGGRDFFRIRVRAGQFVVVEIVARRLDTGMDPQLRLYDETGKFLLAAADDTPGLWQDCRLRHVFSKEGDYIIEVSDVRLQGGPSAAYWLRVGELPEVSLPLPMAVPRGQSARVLLSGPSLLQRLIPVRAPEAPELGGFFAPVATRRSPFHAFVTLLVDDLEERVESEPNDTPLEANRIKVGCAVNGVLQRRGDQDCFAFRVVRGMRLRVETTSRWLNSPADLTLAIRDTTGRELAFSDDEGIDDAALEFTAPHSGWYILVVSELHYRGRADAVYRVRVVPYGPEFRLTLETTDREPMPLAAVAVPQGGSRRCWLRIDRRGYEGPIELRALRLPPGVALDPLTLPAGAERALVTFSASPGAPLGMSLAQLIGYGAVDGRVMRRFLDVSRGVARELGMRFAPPPLAQGLAVAVTGPQPLRLRVPVRSLSLRSGQTVSIPVYVQRIGKLQKPVRLELQGLPPWLLSEPVDVGPRQSTAQLLVRVLDLPQPIETTVVVVGTVQTEKGRIEACSHVLTLRARPSRPAATGPRRFGGTRR